MILRWSLALAVLIALGLSTGLVAGTSAAFNARTRDAATTANASLAVPGSVAAAVQANGGTVRVTWAATATTWATGHRVYRATAAAGPYTQIAQFANRTTLTYDDVPGPGVFYYRVAAYYTGGGANWESQQNGQTGAIKPLASFVFATIGPKVLGTPFSITVTATASDGSTVTAFTQTVALASSVGTLAPTTSNAFVAGVLTQNVTITALVSLNATLTATGGTPTRTGTSNSFIVLLSLLAPSEPVVLALRPSATR